MTASAVAPEMADDVLAEDARPIWSRRMPALPVGIGLFVLLALPLVVALVALSRERWYPVLDLAMTEFRVRDVGTSHTPTIGLPGRIGDFPDQGSHPGPLSFWVLAPVYRLLGQTAYSLEVGAVVVHLLVIGAILWCAFRMAGRTGLLVAAVLVALLTRGYGTVLLTQPWNPYFPLVAWMLVLCAVVAVLIGQHGWIFAVAGAASFCAQTHIPYLLLGIAMFLLAGGAIAVRAWRGTGPRRATDLRLLGGGVAVALALWLAPIGEELFGRGEGNISRLVEHFTADHDDRVGLSEAGARLLRHLNVWEAASGLVHGSEPLVFTGMDLDRPWVPGALLLVLWAGSALVAWRLQSRLLLAMHAISAAGLALTVISIASIFDVRWFYLTLWAWSITALVATATVATAAAAIRRWRPETDRVFAVGGAVAGAIVLVASTVAFSIDANDAEHPEQHLSEGLRPLVDPTYRAIVDGAGVAAGVDGRYVVMWADSQNIGSPGYGLLNELDRLGLDVGGDAPFHVPVTDHRAMLATEKVMSDHPEYARYPVADAIVQYAAGGYVDEFRGRPGAVEVAHFDPRSPEDRQRFEELRSQLIAGLRGDGLDEYVDHVDRNLSTFADGRTFSREIQVTANEMLHLGSETAVFILPLPGSPLDGG